MEYRFTPDEKLDPLDFHLSGWLIYNDSSVPVAVMYRSLFVNGTVEVLERQAPWTFASALGWALTLGALVAAAYFYAAQQPGGVAGVVGNATGAAAAAGKKKGGSSRSSQSAASSSAKETNAAAAFTATPSEPAEASVAASWDTKVYKPSTQQKAVGGKKNKK